MYRSPFRYIPVSALPKEPDALRRALNLEKKKLLAEFELADSTTIQIGGEELHRQDVFGLIESIGNPELLSVHQAIFEDKNLLCFLEEGKVDGEIYDDENPIFQQGSFLQWVSIYYAMAINAYLQSVINGSINADGVLALQAVRPLMVTADTEIAYRYATRFFTEKKNQLLSIRQRAEQGEPINAFEIAQVFTDNQIHLLNRLPDTFSETRYILANILNNLCVIFDRKNANRQALAAIERAATIFSDDDELQTLIPSNLLVIRNKQSKGFFNTNPNTGKKSIKIGWIIALFIVLIRLADVNSCNPNGSDFKDGVMVHYVNDSNRQIFKLTDSVSMALAKLDSVMSLDKSDSISYSKSSKSPLMLDSLKKVPIDSLIILSPR